MNEMSGWEHLLLVLVVIIVVLVIVGALAYQDWPEWRDGDDE